MAQTLATQQTQNIVLITFWSQFSSYALNTILVLFLTRPLFQHGLGYSQAHAYAFIGISQATGYLMPILGGQMADTRLGLRRSILIGSLFLALSYLLVMLSGYTVQEHGDRLFVLAYALLPAANSLLLGTASGLISRIHASDTIHAKSAMTFYYMAINLGALLATLIAPALLDSRYGPLSVLALTFVGKALAALNFAYRYRLYDTVVLPHDHDPLTRRGKGQLCLYFLGIYAFTLTAYTHIELASIVIGFGCLLGIGWFLFKTLRLPEQARKKQLVALLLIMEAVVFFVIYNQMNSTLVLFATYNSNKSLLGFSIAPAQYQMLNPLLILAVGMQLPRLYRRFPGFKIPYQFAAGTLLAGAALLLLAFAASNATLGMVNGNYIAFGYLFISLAELWVSAIGLSMIGLYCDEHMLGLAMGVWYLASSLSNALSGQLARFVAFTDPSEALENLPFYEHYYLYMGLVAVLLGLSMLVLAKKLASALQKQKILVH